VQRRHLQKQKVPPAVRETTVHHSYHFAFDVDGTGQGKAAVLGFEEAANKVVTPEDLACDELSRKWAEKDVAFRKLVGTPFICNDVATGEGLKNSLVIDTELLAEQ